MKRLLEASPSWQKILWAVMAATGLRKGEAVHLLISDFDASHGVIRLRREITKTNRDRVCPLPTRTCSNYWRDTWNRSARPDRSGSGSTSTGSGSS